MHQTEILFLFFGVTDKDFEILEYFRGSTKDRAIHKVFAVESSFLPQDMDSVSRASGYKIIFPVDVKRNKGVSRDTTDIAELLNVGPYSIFYVEKGKEWHYRGGPIKTNGAKAVMVTIEDGEVSVTDVAWMASVLECEL